MWQYPEIDPVAIGIGPVRIHWYAISYLVGIGLVWLSLKYRISHYGLKWTDEDLSDIVFYAVLGVLLGGRIGYMLLYGWDFILADPMSLLRIWEGGMSFHGGLIGVLIAMAVFARKKGVGFFQVTDLIAPSIPLALGCGRIGNFINAELPGRVTDVAWAVVYPGESLGRHPSALYQAVLEGPVLFVVLWLFAMHSRPTMAVSGLFLAGYGSLRVISEIWREPDSHIGFMLGGLTRGQWLSVPMVLLGILFIVLSYRTVKK